MHTLETVGWRAIRSTSFQRQRRQYKMRNGDMLRCFGITSVQMQMQRLHSCQRRLRHQRLLPVQMSSIPTGSRLTAIISWFGACEAAFLRHWLGVCCALRQLLCPDAKTISQPPEMQLAVPRKHFAVALQCIRSLHRPHASYNFSQACRCPFRACGASLRSGEIAPPD